MEVPLPRSLVAAALVLGAALPAPALAAPAPPEAPRRPPLELPAALRAAEASPGATWIVGGRPGARTARIARRHGARSLVPGGAVYRVPLAGARGLARA